MTTLRTLYQPFEANFLNDIEKEKLVSFPESTFIVHGSDENYRWLRPCVHKKFAVRLAKYVQPSFIVEFEMEQQFLDSFNLFPIDGMGKYAWTYWIHLSDRDDFNANLKSNLRIIENFNPR